MISSHGEAMSGVAIRCLRARLTRKNDGFYIGDEETDEAVKLAADARKESEKATCRGMARNAWHSRKKFRRLVANHFRRVLRGIHIVLFSPNDSR